MIYSMCCNIETKQIEWICNGLVAPAYIHAGIARKACEKE